MPSPIRMLIVSCVMAPSVMFMGCARERPVSSPAPVSPLAASNHFDPVRLQPYSTVMQLLLGRVAGLQLITGTNGRSTFRIRGNRDVLLVVDGAPVTGDVDAFLSTLSPAGVDRIEVLRDGGAASVYGSGHGRDAVIILTTRRTPP